MVRNQERVMSLLYSFGMSHTGLYYANIRIAPKDSRQVSMHLRNHF